MFLNSYSSTLRTVHHMIPRTLLNFDRFSKRGRGRGSDGDGSDLEDYHQILLDHQGQSFDLKIVLDQMN